ncbi:MAG: epoxyqueuosine reductase QueH [Spirochaetaceae bacterium]|nr:epoxyqueuosine reductase QueH [Spirochaetaceae bacterium]
MRKIAPDKKGILLHTCCAPCGSSSVERLLHEKYEVTIFFSNSNIFPKEEFLKRLYFVEKLANFYKIALIQDVYDHEAWKKRVSGLEDEPETGKRCFECFKFNLERTAQKARELSIPSFTTTLSVSPHKNSAQIFEAGTNFPEFSKYDFKKQNGFFRSIELSTKLDLYRQDYCGCEFSQRHGCRVQRRDTRSQ